MDNWNKGILGDFITLQRGFDLPAYERHSGNVPVVTSAGISDFHNEAKVKAPGVAMGRYGTIGDIYFIKNDFWPHNTTLYVKDFKGNDPHFVSYFLRTLNYQAHNDKSSVPGLNRNHLHLIPVVFPPLADQQAIAGILGTLDDKIEVNRRMNVTLESIARTVFRQWFVENDDVASWEKKSLYKCAQYINGAAYKDFDFSSDNSGLPIIKIAEIKNGITSQTNFTNKQMDEKYRINDSDILFAWSGSPDTSIDTFIWADGEGWLNQHIFKVIPESPNKKWFTYLLLKDFKEIFIEIARDKQTTGLGHVTVKDLNRLLVSYPPKKLLSEFSSIVDPMIKQIFVNEKESRTLGSLRDSLLPRLMRGEARVKA